MSFSQLNGGVAYVRTDPKPGQQTWNLVRTNFDDHETRIGSLEGGPGTGDVVGPAGATNNEICRFDLATGKLIQGSGITIPDGASGVLSGTNTGDVTLAGTYDYITVSGQLITRHQVDLATDVTGRVVFANLPSAPGKRIIGAQVSGDYKALSVGAGLDVVGDALVSTVETGEFGTGLFPGQYGNAEEFALGACGSAKTIDWDNSNQQYGTLTANCTFTLTNPREAHRYALVLEQAGSGGYSVSFSGVLWMNGDPPDTTTGTIGDVFLITLMRSNASGGTYIGSWGPAS